MSLTPPVGSSGLFQLLTPYDNDLVADVSYVCMAVRRMADVIHLGVDPFDAYYAPKGLLRSDYDRDVVANESIVSLRSNGGAWVFVPTSYVQSYPNTGGIPYQVLVLGVNIGPIPTYLDLTAIKLKIQADIAEMIGVSSTVQTAVISETTNLSQADANALEAARLANVTNTMTDNARYLEMKAQRDAYAANNAELEQWIAAHPASP